MKLQPSALVLATLSLLVPSAASAAPLLLNVCHTGDCGDVSGSVLLDISDVNATDVQLTITNNVLGASTFLTKFHLRYDALSLPEGEFENFTVITGGVAAPSDPDFGPINDASLAFNIDFGFQNGGGPSCDPSNPGFNPDTCGRFQVVESVTFTLVANPGDNFDAGQFSFAMAHVQGLGANGQGSAKLVGGPSSIPEPAMLLLLGPGLAVGAARRRLQTRRAAP